MFFQNSNRFDRKALVGGVEYVLPMLITAGLRMDTDGRLRFQLSREDVSISSRLRFSWMVNTDKEYTAAFRYIITRGFSLSTHYDSDMAFGTGISIIY